MAMTIDHLRVDHWIRVIRGFRDAAGTEHPEGEEAILREMRWRVGEPLAYLVLEQSGGERVEIPFTILGKEGPANGRMREYFELGEAVAVERPPAPIPELEAPVPQLLPRPEVLLEPALEQMFDRVVALAARGEFEAAEDTYIEMRQWPEVFALRMTQLGEWFEHAAMRFAVPGREEAFEYLARTALSSWYAWAGQATSGGEGTDRMREIRRVEKNFEQAKSKMRG